jgi:predicted glycoside hydrolase/deacetylase ChbG (UPF0249 family)
VHHFTRSRLQRVSYNLLISRLVRACIADQLDGFRDRYGRDPTHIDGHNHAHLSPTVLLALPRGTATRTAEGPLEATASPGSLIRRARHVLIARRHITTDYFRAIDSLGPSLTEQDIDRLLAPADHASLEIMVHPDRDSDYRLLTTERWRRALRARTLGSFLALSAGSSQ